MVYERQQAERTVNGRLNFFDYETPIPYGASLIEYGAVIKPTHNYPIALGSIAFPQHRQFGQHISKQVKDLSNAGLKLSLIESVLLQ